MVFEFYGGFDLRHVDVRVDTPSPEIRYGRPSSVKVASTDQVPWGLGSKRKTNEQQDRKDPLDCAEMSTGLGDNSQWDSVGVLVVP